MAGTNLIATLLLLSATAMPVGGLAISQFPASDQVRLAEAFRLSSGLGDSLWPGWKRAPLAVLLVSDSTEFLIGHPRPSPDFARTGRNKTLAADVWARPRQFPATLLATFPAVSGLPTIVIGSAERTGKSSTAWVLTLLHEHFHQWQYSLPNYYDGVAALDLERGDSTGQWMLNYPFPYDSAPVQQAMRRLATALLQALDARPEDRAGSVKAAISARDDLRRILAAADYRYFEFQLWQEGVARYIEYAAASAAGRSGLPLSQFRQLPDYQPYDSVARVQRRHLRQELSELDLGRERRVAFYPVGAAVAMLLEESRCEWKQAYAERPFALTPLLSAGKTADCQR